MKKVWSKLKDIEVPIRCINYRKINGYFVPCGKCIHCRKRMANDWGFRCESEADDRFVFNALLTYDEESLPKDGFVNKVHIQLFMKRFRWFLKSMFDISDLRYLIVGEYGGHFGRPHYHCLFFSKYNFCSEEMYDMFKSIIYLSWNKGFVNLEPIENVKASCYYMTAYMMGHDDGKVYTKLNKPFRLMSRRPGFGRNWIENHPKTVAKCVQDMDYTYRVDGKDKSYKKQLPRYIRNIIIPEEQKNYFTEQFYDHCVEFSNFLIELNYDKQKFERYKERRKQISDEFERLSREEYEQTKLHKRRKGFRGASRDASQLFTVD